MRMRDSSKTGKALIFSNMPSMFKRYLPTFKLILKHNSIRPFMFFHTVSTFKIAILSFNNILDCTLKPRLSLTT